MAPKKKTVKKNKSLSKMRQESFLCDLVIGTKTKSFDVHKVDLNDIAPLGLATIHTLVKMCTAQKFIRDNFLEFAESDQFLKLTFEQINELLIDDDLQLPSEIVAFQIAMKWLEFDQKRVKYAADLLSNIRFGTISAQDLVNYVQSQALDCDIVSANMAPKKKTVKKNKSEINEMTIIVEDSPLSKLSALNGLLEGGNGLSCISSELTDASYGPNLLEGLSKMRQESFLCDLVIGTKTKSFDVHKSVMASCSEYFYNILKRDPSTQRVDLNDIAPLGLATVIAYAYTGKLTLSLYTIGSILSAAVYLQIHTLVKMCSDFLIREMSVENCMYIANIAAEPGLGVQLRVGAPLWASGKEDM
ncbi:hypothetical protein CB1_000602019 [Camelus ferus]|nr:hypothetical protein CB1_000602019 [Camelus ferus]